LVGFPFWTGRENARIERLIIFRLRYSYTWLQNIGKSAENTSLTRIAEVNSGSFKGIFSQLNISLYHMVTKLAHNVSSLRALIMCTTALRMRR
jgi:hypothetical protein